MYTYTRTHTCCKGQADKTRGLLQGSDARNNVPDVAAVVTREASEGGALPEEGSHPPCSQRQSGNVDGGHLWIRRGHL